MHRIVCRIAPLFALLFAASAMIGQVATGAYPYGTFDTPGIDTINVGNLNVHLSFPILSKTGRGLPFNANLTYDSSVFSPLAVGGPLTWTPVTQFGWNTNTGLLLGNFSHSGYGYDDQVIVPYYVGPPQNYINVPVNCYWSQYYNWVFTDASGVAHALGGSTWQFNGQDWSPDGYTCDTSMDNPNGTGSANDGSGLKLTVTNYTQATATAPNGTATAYTSGSAGTLTDSNGNRISTDGAGNFTDTTGNVVLRVTGNTSSSQYFTYYDTGGNPQNVTVNYSSYTVQTNFGCSGIGEYGPTAKYLVSSIVYPDGSAYHFSYEPTPGYSSNVTGRLHSITVPQGNTITYSYTGSNNGIECADGSTAGLTRLTNSDSGSAATSLTYSRTITGSGTSQTNVADGLGNNKIYTFAEPSGTTALYYENSRKVYQGAATGTPVLTLTTCFNGVAPPCTSLPTLPISQIDTYQLLDGIQMNGTETMINSSGMATSSTVYDFGGASSRGSALRSEQWTYGYTGIPSLVTQDEVFAGAVGGTEAGNTTYAYDGGTLQTTYVVPQHVAVSGPRGNLTSVTQYANATTSYTTTASYEDTGSIISSTGPNGTTAYGYDSSTFVYLLGVGLPTPSSGVSLTVGESYDTTHTGVPTGTTDPNGYGPSYPANKYDSMLRPTEQDNPDGGKITWTYTPTMVTTTTLQSTSPSVYGQTINQLDGYGRPSRTFVANGQSTNPWYQQDTCYDANGNVSFVSYRYQGSGTGSSKVCSGAGTTYAYDVLGRVTSVTQSNSETRTTTYTGRATKNVDENNVARISQVDGLGRTTIVCEISTNNTMPGSGNSGSCGTDITGTGFITQYSYALATGTTTVTQGTQTRSFQNDWLGRPVASSEPEESGTPTFNSTTYTYAYNASPSTTGLGLVVTRQKPKANQTTPSVTTTTTTQYDTVGRPVTISYNDGITPNKTFYYDASAGWGSGYPQTYIKGRLSKAVGDGGWADTMYSYDPMGRTILLGECTPAFCTAAPNNARSLNYTYDLAGDLLTSTDGSGVTTTYTVSQANEVLTMTSSLVNSTNPASILSNVTNGPYGPVSWTLGNSLHGVYSYDSLGRLGGGWACSGSSLPGCSGGTQTYGFAAVWKGSQLQTSSDTVLNQASNYTYDEFNRLKTRTVTSGSPVTNLSWTYDRWGNRWSQTVTAGSGPQPSYSFNTSNNQISTSGFTYDAAGNQTYDTVHHYTYDAEGNILNVDSGSTATYVYDPLNHRVETTVGSVVTDFFFNTNGQRVSEWNASTHAQLKGHYYWGSKPVAYYTTAAGGGAAAHFEHQDWEGTERMRTAYNGSVEITTTSLPYGDAQSTSGTDTDANHFAQLDFDTESGTDHAQFRQYSPTEGRWLRPDPYSGSYNMSNPQSMNRYVYVMNNPLSGTDPNGLAGPCDELGFCFGNDNGAPGGNGGAGSGVSSSSFCFTILDGYATGYQDADGSNFSPYPACLSLGQVGSPGGPGSSGTGGSGTIDAGNGHTVTTKQPLNSQQKQCIDNEINYANRTRNDFMSGQTNRMLKTIGGGALTGALAGGKIGVELGLGEGPVGWLVGGFVGATVGAGGAVLTGAAKEGFSDYRYDNSIMGIQSTYASNLQNNIQKNCGVSVNVQ